MDQKRIGLFIARCRKEKRLTQMQLAELLEVTNQAVSKWENSRGMPDVSLLQPLCDALDISLNELFSGEHISVEEYRARAEENMSRLFKEKQIADKKPAKRVFSICGKASLTVAGIEVAVGVVGYFFHPILLKVMLLNASVWLILCLAFMSAVVYEERKLKSRKQAGISLDAEIEEIIPALWIRIGNYVSCRVICRFLQEGREYKAVSGYYVLTPFQRKEDLYARVFIDRERPERYSVELFQTR